MAAALWLAANAAQAQVQVQAVQPLKDSDQAVLSGVTIVPPEARPTCTPVDPRLAASDGYDCLNQDLARPGRFDADQDPARAAARAAASTRAGTFSYSAVRQRMGGNFGRAAVPSRPGRPVYVNPIIAGRP